MHAFSFVRAGGFDQIHFANGADLLALDELDQKLWVALACPTKGIEFDTRTLEFLDVDKDGRIRAPELIAATTWLRSILARPASLMERRDGLAVSELSSSDEAKAIAATMSTILERLGKPTTEQLTVLDASAAVDAYAARPFNGDGVVPPASADYESTQKLAEEVIACFGGATDRSGAPGINQEKVDAFFQAVNEHAAWLAEATPKLQPAGDRTAAAYEAYLAVRAKIDDFFARSALAAFDERALAPLNRDEKEYAALAVKELNVATEEIAALPLAKIEPHRALPLFSGVNPAWEARIRAFATHTVKPLAGETSVLTATQWAHLNAQLAPYEAWRKTIRGAAVESLGPQRIRALTAPNARTPLDELLAKEKAEEPLATTIAAVEKLVRFHRDIASFASNYVNFEDFYSRRQLATFQAGTLYLDQRSCNLTLKVEDIAKHAAMAGGSHAYLAYCECTRPGTAQKMSIVAAFTAGDSDFLSVGRNGLFYDRQGNDWDANIVKIVENPLSIRQAFFSPYKRLARFVEAQISKRAATADAASDGKLAGGATEAAAAAEAGKPGAAAPAEPAKKIDIGTVAALGVAVGGITAALGMLLQAFFGLGVWIPLGIVGLLFVISAPSMLLAWLKLRQRNLAPILDASGWAVNARARLNVPFGGSLTEIAQRPPGSTYDARDPYAEKRTPWKLYLFLIVLIGIGVAWFLGLLDARLPSGMRRSEVFASVTQTQVKG